MTELATKTVEETVEDLDLGPAEIDELEAALDHDAGKESTDHKAGKAVPLSASFRLPVYNDFDPAIAKLAEEAAVRIRNHGESTRRSVVEIGRELLAIKDKLGHGQFGKWIEAEFDMTSRAAQNYMNVARMAKRSEIVLGLPDTALQLLAAPGVDAVRDNIIKAIADDIKAGKPAPRTKSVKEMINNATSKAKTPVKAASANTSSAATSISVKAAPAATPTSLANSSITNTAEADPAEIRVSAATSKTATAGTASATSNLTRSATREQAAAAARLMNMLKNALPTFAKLYDIAGHDVFRKAMADALQATVTLPQQTKQAA